MNNQKDVLNLLKTLRSAVKQVHKLGHMVPEQDKNLFRKTFANLVLIGVEVRDYAGLPKKERK